MKIVNKEVKRRKKGEETALYPEDVDTSFHYRSLTIYTPDQLSTGAGENSFTSEPNIHLLGHT